MTHAIHNHPYSQWSLFYVHANSIYKTKQTQSYSLLFLFIPLIDQVHIQKWRFLFWLFVLPFVSPYILDINSNIHSVYTPASRTKIRTHNNIYLLEICHTPFPWHTSFPLCTHHTIANNTLYYLSLSLHRSRSIRQADSLPIRLSVFIDLFKTLIEFTIWAIVK